MYNKKRLLQNKISKRNTQQVCQKLRSQNIVTMRFFQIAVYFLLIEVFCNNLFISSLNQL